MYRICAIWLEQTAAQWMGERTKNITGKTQNENNNKQKGVKKFVYACAVVVVVFFSFVFHFIHFVGCVQNTNRQYQIENAHTATQWPNRTEFICFSLCVCFFCSFFVCRLVSVFFDLGKIESTTTHSPVSRSLAATVFVSDKLRKQIQWKTIWNSVSKLNNSQLICNKTAVTIEYSLSRTVWESLTHTNTQYILSATTKTTQ